MRRRYPKAHNDLVAIAAWAFLIGLVLIAAYVLGPEVRDLLREAAL